MPRALLGGATAKRFLSRYWQKRPLFIPQALPGFRSFLSWNDLARLALRDDVESRLVLREGRRWTLAHGPFRLRDLSGLPPRNWTLLVQGVNLRVAEGDTLLRSFSFVPYARLDDLMVSYAAPGGGVGPHFDSYDVFLLQGEGRKRWRIGRQRDLALRANLPLKILARFHPETERVLEAGDMLYLPPDVAHYGVAIDACSTYSIGFRAPTAQELATGFLDAMRDAVALEGRYRDPDLMASREPARIGRDLHAYAAKIVAALQWNDRAIARCLGAQLTEPKPTVTFSPPRRPMSLSEFARRAAHKGLRLDSRTQLLYDAAHLFVNGEVLEPPARTRALLRRLANARELEPMALSREAARIAYRWYGNGFLHIR
jgi:50S ribosomal protein L16 3-hydroxylase